MAWTSGRNSVLPARTKIVSAAGSGGGYDAVVAADIIGGDAHADMLDQRRDGASERRHIARGTGTNLLMPLVRGAQPAGAPAPGASRNHHRMPPVPRRSIHLPAPGTKRATVIGAGSFGTAVPAIVGPSAPFPGSTPFAPSAAWSFAAALASGL